VQKYYSRRLNKLLLVGVLLIILVSLSSCRNPSWYNEPYTTWANEFNFSNAGWAIIGWPVSILSYPFGWLMYNIGHVLNDSLFWGIVLTTLIIRTVAWPIYNKQNGYQMKMALLQPEITKIQTKYAGRKDAQSQQRQQAETMALYKKYKVNPAGCLGTTILQFPIFIAMYEAVRRINLPTTHLINGSVTVVENGVFNLAHTKFLNTIDLTGKFNFSFDIASWDATNWFTLIIAIAFGGITYLSQKLTSKKPSYAKKDYSAPVKRANAPDPAKQTQTMMFFMNFVFIVMALSSTSLAIYWLVGAIYQIGQSQLGRYLNEKNYYKMEKKDTII